MNRIGLLTGVLPVEASIVSVRRVEASWGVTVYSAVAAWLLFYGGRRVRCNVGVSYLGTADSLVDARFTLVTAFAAANPPE